MGWTAGAGVRECAGRACERAHSACVRLNPSPRPPTHAATFTPSAPPRALAQPRALHPLVSSPSHTEMIFGLAVDAARGLVVRCAMNANSAWEHARRPARPHPPTHPPAHSPTNPPTHEPTHAPNHALWSPPACSGGKDSFLQVWTAEGQPLQRLDLGDRLGGGRWGGTGGWGAARRGGGALHCVARRRPRALNPPTPSPPPQVHELHGVPPHPQHAHLHGAEQAGQPPHLAGRLWRAAGRRLCPRRLYWAGRLGGTCCCQGTHTRGARRGVGVLGGGEGGGAGCSAPLPPTCARR